MRAPTESAVGDCGGGEAGGALGGEGWDVGFAISKRRKSKLISMVFEVENKNLSVVDTKIG